MIAMKQIVEAAGLNEQLIILNFLLLLLPFFLYLLKCDIIYSTRILRRVSTRALDQTNVILIYVVIRTLELHPEQIK